MSGSLWVYVHVLMRDEKEERKKQARSNKQTRQSNTACTGTSPPSGEMAGSVREGEGGRGSGSCQASGCVNSLCRHRLTSHVEAHTHTHIPFPQLQLQRG